MWLCDWHWRQGICPATRIEEEGFGSVKLKAGGSSREGWGFIDSTFHASALRVRATRMVPAAYWYLMPGKPHAQAGLFLDLLEEAGGLRGWAPQLDVEQAGLTSTDILAFMDVWRGVAGTYPITMYTNRNVWIRIHGALSPGGEGGLSMTPYLEEARWVSQAFRFNADKPYASQQAHGIDPGWWKVNYAGWKEATLLQFTDNALVAGVRTTCSMFRGDANAFRALLTRTT